MTHRWNASRSFVVGALCAVVAVSGFLTSAGGLLATGVAEAATLPSLNVALTKSSVTVGGSLQAGAVNVVTTGAGAKEASATIVRLNPGVSAAELLAFANSKAASDPNDVSKFGSIVLYVEAGSEVQTTLTAGQYVAFGEAEGKTVANSTFTIAPAASPIALPTPQATIRSIDFGFRGPATLHRGELVRFENEGFVVHMDIAFRVKSHRAAKRLVGALRSGNEKQERKLIAGPPTNFQGPVSNGVYQQETITAKPGWYVQACFMDTQDGREHTRLGMERIIRILK